MLLTCSCSVGVTGQEVRTPGGTAIGRVEDLTVHLGEQSGPLLVARLLVRRRHSADLLVSWEAVRSFQRSGVVLESDAGFTVGAVDAALEPDEILLKRDVLDTQIVDVVGQRIAWGADAVLLIPLLFALIGLGRDRDLMGPFTMGRVATTAYGLTTAMVVLCVAILAASSLTG